MAQIATSTPWSSQAQEALGRLEIHDFNAAIALAQQLGNSSASPQVRAECAAVEILIALRGSDRQNLLDARVQLRTLANDIAGLLERPECQLGLGIAGVSLAETAGAIEYLEKAVAAFKRDNRTTLESEALAALAEAWSVHGEWEITPGKYLKRRPRTPRESALERVAQIESIRKRVPADASPAVDRIDLSLARALAALPQKTDARIELLSRLAEPPIQTAIAAESGTMLTAALREVGREEGAIAALESVAASGVQPFATLAKNQLQTARRSPLQVAIVANEDDPTVNTFTIRSHVAATGVAEIRRVDLEAWLSAAQGRVAFESLPTTGSFIAEHAFAFSEGETGAADGATNVFQQKLAAGAYVVVLRSSSTTGQRTQKQLFIADALPASALIGAKKGIVWTAPRTERDRDGAIEGLFWMHGSFVPRRFAVNKGVGAFEIPPEAKVLIDSRWVCLLKQANRLALIQGELDRSRIVAATNVRALLVAGPTRPRVGDNVHVAGILLDEAGKISTAYDGQEIEISLRNNEERAVARGFGHATNGMFATKILIDAGVSAESLRVRVRIAKKPIPTHEANRVVIGPNRDIALVGAVSAKNQLHTLAAEFPFSIRAWYPWGVACAELSSEVVLSAIGLPTSERPQWREFDPYFHPKSFDDGGEMSAAISLESFENDRNPQLMTLGVLGSDADFGALHSYHAALRAEDAKHAWVGAEPRVGVAGRPLALWGGWASAAYTTLAARPTIEITGSEAYATTLEAQSSARMGFSEWTPPSPGTFEARIRIPLVNGIAESATSIRVDDAATEVPQADDQRATPFGARLAQSGNAIEVSFPARIPRPMLLIAANEEPQAGLWVLPEQTPGTVSVDFAATSTISTILAMGDAVCDPEQVTQVPVSLAQESGLRIDGAELAKQIAYTESGKGRIVFTPSAIKAGMPVFCWLEKAGANAAASLLQREKEKHIGTSGKLAFRLSSNSNPSPESGSELPYKMIQVAEHPSTIFDVMSDPQVIMWSDVVIPCADRPSLELSVPSAPNYYRCWLAQPTVDGMRLQNILIDRAQTLDVTLDFPRLVAPGDRPVLTMAIRNAQSVPLAVEIGSPGGSGVHFEGFLDDAGQLHPNMHAKRVELNGGEVRFVRAAMEIESGGADGFVRVTVRENGTINTIDQPFLVQKELPIDAKIAGIEIRRSIRRGERQIEYFDEITGEPQEGGNAVEYWSAVEASFDESFASGQILIVREVVNVPESLRGVRWRQRLPSNCSYVEPPPDAIGSFHALGPVREMAPEAFTTQIQELTPGTHVHEYWMRAGRGGSGLFPLPEVTASQGAIPIQMLPIAPQITTYVR